LPPNGSDSSYPVVLEQHRYDALVALAKHCWRGVHWEKGEQGPRPVREPLKKQHLERHLDGSGPGVGLAPIVPGEATCRIAVLDFDDHSKEFIFAEVVGIAMRVRERLSVHDLMAPIAFRSSGGHGVHLIMLWDEPQDAYSVRTLLAGALASCGLKSGTKGVKHGQVEIFPKQDDVPPDGLGNMFVLPFTGKSELLDKEIDIRAWPKSRPVPVLERVTTVQKPSTMDPASLPTNLAELKSALAAIPNEGDESQDYDSWRDVIFAVHHATEGSAEGLALAHEFSSRSSKYDPEFLDERVWPYARSDRTGKVITAASLYNRARQHGWVDDVLAEFEDLGPAEADAVAVIERAKGKPERFAVVPIGEFSKRKHPGWIVRPILPRVELALIIGESGSGKSFLAFDMGAAIAAGTPWRGFKTKQGRVIIVVAEGAGFFHQRALAYAQHHDTRLDSLGIGVISDAPNLMQKEEVKSVVEQIRKFGKVDVIIVDTLAQASAGANENSGEDMGVVLANCKALHRATGAVIVLVHHVGKDESRGARGWSGLKAAADAEITVTRREEVRAAVVSKMKDAADGLELPFKLVEVEVGKDDDGERITSCVVEHLEASQGGRQARQPAGDIAKHLLLTAHNLALLGGDETTVQTVLDEAVKEMVYDPDKRDRRREVATRALQGLASQGFLRVENGRVLLSGGA
jgi:hypothetical protein